MRAREFVINVPITISINGDGEPDVNVADSEAESPEEDKVGDDGKVFVPPLQQDLELRKSAMGKQTIVSDQILDPDGEGPLAAPSDARRAGHAHGDLDHLDNLGVGVFEGK